MGKVLHHLLLPGESEYREVVDEAARNWMEDVSAELSYASTKARYMISNGGQEVYNAASSCTGFIAVTAGSTVILRNVYPKGLREIAGYNSNQEFVDVYATDSDATTVRIVIPSGISFLRATANASTTSVLVSIAASPLSIKKANR